MQYENRKLMKENCRKKFQILFA